jgi:orotidine-5'-phosphate decarboxylase
MTSRERLIVALDVPGVEEARSLAMALRGRVGMFKVGSQLFTAAGPDFVRELVDHGDGVFLDLKFHDIPNTVARAVESARALGVSLVTVHAVGGSSMLAGAAKALDGSTTRLLAITVLTSHDDASLRELGIDRSVERQVLAMARLAREAGVHGVVASPNEVAAIRGACGPDLLIVTPGIRPTGAASDDQARAATPAAALSAGADYLVIGRPITRATDPGAAADAIVASLPS